MISFNLTPSPDNDMGHIFRPLEAESLLRAYYTGVKALSLSSLRRPSLPVEIVLYICQLAEFAWPNTHLSSKVDYDRSLAGTIMKGEDNTITRPWLCTRPVPRALLGRIWKAEPRIHPTEPVMSRTHAFKPDELVIRIISPECSVSPYKCNSEGEMLSWRHLTSTHKIASSARIFDSEHEIWRSLEPGDRLEISVEASNWYFPNVRSEWGVSLQVFTFWEPSEDMLNLIYSGYCRVL
ncbi:hypothetical protein FRC12_005807 [Ceratobasidium sp. 428]|nr:hypothetical protein FRC12_005807 [Ceratobasidium sp. 428]